MEKYIDAQKIKFSGQTFDDGIGDKFVLLDDVRMAIEQTPAEDVVPVVRCNDCKFYKVSEKFSPNKFCYRLLDNDCKPVGYSFDKEDFCSYGERKDNEKN